MFSNTIHQVCITDILIDRVNRQRTDLTPDSVLPLAVSIANSQWISPVLVDEETNYLIAGERRLLAVKCLNGAVNGDYSTFSDPKLARETLDPVCTCKIDSWNQWSRIPAQLGRMFTPTDLVMYEFIENAHRQDLSWQDRARAIYDVHAKGLSQNRNWTGVHTANLLGINRASVTESLRVWRLFSEEGTDPEIKTIVNEAQSLRSAAQTIERFQSRRETGLGVSLMSSGAVAVRPKAEISLAAKPGPKPLTPRPRPVNPDPEWEEEEEITTPPKLSDCFLNADFTTWAAEYSGAPFNFIHCDFPYGISFNTGEQARTVNNAVLGEYDDSAEVYWSLLETLKLHRNSLISPQAHIMFWFSQNHRRETEDFFTAMGARVEPFLMIWHCSDGDGIVPDSQRYGRRTYETAMLVTFGDRKIVAPRALSVAASRDARTRIHRSQKPLKVLEHFFEMFVDDSSTFLDPTAGSGTSLVAANNLNAARITGLELDPSIHKAACGYVDNMTGLGL